MNDLATKQETNIIPAEGGMLAMIERAATDPNVDVEKMERLYEMYSKMQARQAETEFNLAMNKSQSETSRIAADANNPQTRSQYASYGKLDKVLRPIYTKHGFSISFDTGDTEKADCVRVLAHVSHSAGHTRTYQADMDASGKGAKGGDVMTKTHATGSAMSYGMRYLLKLIFNVAIGEEDNDGNTPEDAITEEQSANINSLLDELTEDDAKEVKFKMFKWLKIESIDDIPAKQYDKVVKRLEEKRADT